MALPCGFQIVPDQGSNLCPLQQKYRVLSTGLPGKSQHCQFWCISCINNSNSCILAGRAWQQFSSPQWSCVPLHWAQVLPGTGSWGSTDNKASNFNGDYWCWASFHVLAGYLHFLFGKMSIQFFCSLFNQISLSLYFFFFWCSVIWAVGY